MRHIAVFCASHKGKNPHFESAAQELGQLIALGGRTLVYGGSNLGYMGTVSDAVLSRGGRVVGVIPTIFSDEVIASQPVSELVTVASMAERKEYIIHRSDGFVALPGGIGTLDELTEVLVANQLGLCSKPVGILNVDGFFDFFLNQISEMEKEGFLRYGVMESLFVEQSPDILLKKMDAFQPIPEDKLSKAIRR